MAVKTWKIILGIVFSIAALVVLVFFFAKMKILDNPGFYVFIFSTFLISLVISSIIFLSNKIDKRPTEKKKMGIEFYVSGINEQLSRLPGADVFIWKKGEFVRYKTKRYGKERFVAIIGNTVNYNRMLVIFNIEENLINDYFIPPTEEQEIDPFYEFMPEHKDTHDIYKDYYGARARRPYRAPQQIIIGGQPPPLVRDDEQNGSEDSKA